MTAVDHAGRLARLRAAIDEHPQVDALVVTDLLNVRWLIGFDGSNATLVVTPDRLVVHTDGRYAEAMGAQLAAVGLGDELLVSRTEGETLAPVLEALGGRVGLEADSITWGRQHAFEDAWPSAALVPTSAVVEGLRTVKDASELALMARAAEIADAALADVLPMLVDLPTEREVATELLHRMAVRGSEGPSFDPIVAAGPSSSRPHNRPGAQRVVPGLPVVIDWGATVGGYRSDCTRSVVVGDPSPGVAELFEVVAAAHGAGVAAIRAGVVAEDVHAATRAVVESAGLGEHFTHPTGHGIGLAVHERPYLAAGTTATLPVGFVVTVEPGVYVPGLGGVRLEDTVVVTASGCHPLTHADRTPTCVG